jgi:hypothetical protein
MIAQTVQLAFRIAFVWAGGFLLGVAVFALLPDSQGLTFNGKHGSVYVAFNRMGFWTCMWAAVTVTILVVIRAMMGDVSSGSIR